MYLDRVLNILHWLQTLRVTLGSFILLLVLQEYATMPDLCDAGNQTQASFRQGEYFLDD